MVNLINTCVLIKTPEENEKLLKEAEKNRDFIGTQNTIANYYQYNIFQIF